MASYKSTWQSDFSLEAIELAVALKKHIRTCVHAHTQTHMCACTSAIGDNHRSSSQQHPEGKKGEASKLSSVGKQEVLQEYLYNRIPSEKFQFIPEI